MTGAGEVGPHHPARFVAAAAAGGGLLAAALTWYCGRLVPGWAGGDFTWVWRAARVLAFDHQDPYRVIQATGRYPFSSPLYYPLPAVVVALPLASLGPAAAAATFVGVSTGLLVLALSRTQRALATHWPLFVSAAFFNVCWSAQWSPLLIAATLLPGLGWLWAVKPTIGLALWVSRPSLRTLAAGLLAYAVCSAIWPQWLPQWIGAMRQPQGHRPPALATIVGPLLLLAVLRWRRPEARLLLALALVPQTNYFYEQLPLWLVAATPAEGLLLALTSWAAFAAALGAGWIGNESVRRWAVALGCYLPCLVMVLRRPNEGALPPRLERALAVARARLALTGRQADAARR